MTDNTIKGVHVGEIYQQKHGELEIIEYKGARAVTVKFLDTGTVRKVSVAHIKLGCVVDEMFPSVCGFGFIGKGIYRKSTHKDIYNDWQCMIHRCYGPRTRNSLLIYDDCSVCEEWKNFQNFAEWATQQPERLNRTWALDKDITIKNNREYSPEACAYIPPEINTLLVNCRGKNQVGASFHKHSGKWRTDYKDTSTKRKVKYFETQQEALDFYKVKKEMYIKHIAEKYRAYVNPKIYNALMKYEVNSDD